VAITARLQHPAIVPVHDSGVWESGEPYYVMKLLSGGRTLKEAVAEAKDLNGRLALLPNVIAVADAIAYAHSLEIIHRDLKPSNVLVGPFGETVVIDWGLAKNLSQPPSSDDLGDDPYRTAAPDLTSAGSIMGTPQYMAPEQARGEAADKRADVYALGGLLFFVIAGAAPFGNEPATNAIQRARLGTLLPLPSTGLPADLSAIIRKAMATDPGARYANASDFVEDLRRFQTGQLVRAQEYSSSTLMWRWVMRHRSPVTATVVFLIALTTMALFGIRRISRARDAADQQRAAAVAQRNELILRQAKSSLVSDPTSTLA
jgi:serine/threonine protein kinase